MTAFNKRRKIPLPPLLLIWLLGVCGGCTVAALLPIGFIPRLFIIIFVLACGCITFFIWRWIHLEIIKLVAIILSRSDEDIEKYVHATSLPMAVTSEKGYIIWHNPSFYALTGSFAVGRKISQTFSDLRPLTQDNKLQIGGKWYYREDTVKSIRGRNYTLYRFIDTVNSYDSAELYKIVTGTVMHIQVDNLDDMRRATDPAMHSEIDAETIRQIARYAANINGMYQRYDRDKYLILFERRYLERIIQNRFSLLEDVRKINTGSQNVHPTLSLGIGVALEPKTANSRALKALEMALGRGGDQAVLLNENEFKFYGGVQQGRERRTRVRVRMFASALKNLMEESNRVVIMGHQVPDLDCMGSALGLYACARSTRIPAFIVIDQSVNASIRSLVEELKHNPEYKGMLVTPQEAQNFVNEQTMLIVTDTQQRNYTIAPQLLKRTKTIAVIDHHLRGTDYIDDAALMLHEPYASSACEMVTEIVEYFQEDAILQPLEAEALLAGITIDTKGFSFKTSARTFDAASYLRKMGADTIRINNLFRDDLKTFIARAHIVEGAEVENGFAIAVCPADIQNPQLLAAQAADTLLTIRGVMASFVLCVHNGQVMISGRSRGKINVQRILEKMGGGGHATMAGAQIKGDDIKNAVDKLKGAISEYEKEEAEE